MNPGKTIEDPELIHDDIAFRYKAGADVDRAYSEMYEILGLDYIIVKGG